MGNRAMVRNDSRSRKRRRRAYRVYGIDPATGARKLLGVDGLVVEVLPGVEVEIDLIPHERFLGQLGVFCPPRAVMRQQYEAGIADSFAVIFGAENVLHVIVERRTRTASRAEPSRAPTKPRARKRTK